MCIVSVCGSDYSVCCMSGTALLCVFFFQAEDGIRDLVRSRGLGDVYKRQPRMCPADRAFEACRCVSCQNGCRHGLSLRKLVRHGHRTGPVLSLIHI